MTEKRLRPYQVEDLAFLMREDRFGLLSDPRTGKTPPACVYMDWLWNEKGQKTIWSMPAAILQKNYDELLTWSRFAPSDIVIWNGRNDTLDSKVFLMTFKRFALSWQELLNRHPQINAHVVDEIHFTGGFSTDASNATQQLYQCMQKIDRFVPMTGSLINGRLSSAYPTIRLIEPRYYSSEANFLAFHEVRDPFTGKRTGWTNHARLRTIIDAHSSRRSFRDVFGDKSIVLDVERVRMAPQQRAKYDEFEKNALLELEDRFLEGSLPGVNVIRCRQIMGHPENVRLPIAYNDKGEPIAWKSYDLVGKEPTGKDACLELHLKDHLNTGKPVIVFAALVAEQERIFALAKKVGLRSELINHNTNLTARGTIDKAFRAGTIDCVVASAATAGVGFNWGHVDHIIFVSVDYQDTNFLQGLMRGMTPEKDGLLISILEYEKSIDQRMFQIIETKSRDAHAVDPTRPIISLAQGKLLFGSA